MFCSLYSKQYVCNGKIENETSEAFYFHKNYFVSRFVSSSISFELDLVRG